MRLFSETPVDVRLAVSVGTMKTNRMAMSTAAGIAALTLALTGCSGGSGESADDGQSSSAATDAATGSGTQPATEDQTGDDAGEESDDSTALPADADLSKDSPSVSPEDAIDTATEETGGDGIVHGIELDWDDRDEAWQYDVSILTGTTDHDIEIDAETGEVVEHEKESTDDKEKAIDLTEPMTVDDALTLAQEKTEGKLTGWKLEYDDGRHEYQFDFEKDGQEIETTVDTETKRVTVDDD